MIVPDILARVKKWCLDVGIFVERRHAVIFVKIATMAREGQVRVVVRTAAGGRDDVFNFKREIEDYLRRATVFAPVASTFRNRRGACSRTASVEECRRPQSRGAQFSLDEGGEFRVLVGCKTRIRLARSPPALQEF